MEQSVTEVTGNTNNSEQKNTQNIPQKKTLKDIREENTEMLMRNMKEGNAAWQAPEKVEAVGMPQDARGKKYEGVNAVVLATAAIEKGFDDPRWVSRKQISDANRFVQKGEKATYIEVADFFKRDDKGNKVYENEKPVILEKPNVYVVAMFNVCQISGHERYYPREHMEKNTPKEPDLAKAEAIINGTNVQISHCRKPGEWPRYDAVADTIEMPPEKSFQSKEAYCAEILHQLAHATGNESRQNREGVYKPMGAGYKGVPLEELRGEVASFFIRQELGIKLGAEHDKTNYAKTELVSDSILKKDGKVHNPGILAIVCNDANRMKNEVVKMGREITKTIEGESKEHETPVQEKTQEKVATEKKIPQPKKKEPEHTSEMTR